MSLQQVGLWVCMYAKATSINHTFVFLSGCKYLALLCLLSRLDFWVCKAYQYKYRHAMRSFFSHLRASHWSYTYLAKWLLQIKGAQCLFHMTTSPSLYHTLVWEELRVSHGNTPETWKVTRQPWILISGDCAHAYIHHTCHRTDLVLMGSKISLVRHVIIRILLRNSCPALSLRHNMLLPQTVTLSQ